jgi:hypothetical protein
MYTPNPNFNFGTDVSLIQVCDLGTPGVSCTNQTLTITVTAVNDAPIVDNDSNITTTEDNPNGGDLTDAGDKRSRRNTTSGNHHTSAWTNKRNHSYQS